MATRVVTGTIRKPDGTAWAAAEVKFTLRPGTFDDSTHYPKDTVTGLTNGSGALKASDGTAALSLWCNADGLTLSHYLCEMPDGDQYTFDLSAGDGTPIDLQVLRAAGATLISPDDPAYAAIEALAVEIVEDALAEIPERWPLNFTDDADAYIPAREEMTFSLSTPAVGTGTLSYARSTAATPSVFTAATLPAAVEEGGWLRVTASGVSGFLALELTGGTVPHLPRWVLNFTGAGDIYVPVPEAMILNAGVAQIGTATLAYAKSTSAAPGTFTSTTLPATLEAGAWLRVTASAVTGFAALELRRVG